MALEKLSALLTAPALVTLKSSFWPAGAQHGHNRQARVRQLVSTVLLLLRVALHDAPACPGMQAPCRNWFVTGGSVELGHPACSSCCPAAVAVVLTCCCTGHAQHCADTAGTRALGRDQLIQAARMHTHSKAQHSRSEQQSPQNTKPPACLAGQLGYVGS